MTLDDLIAVRDDPQADEAEALAWAIDKIEGLEEDLKSAIEVAWIRGAKIWVRNNYPAHAARLSRIE
jgi:hypothetical protein